MSTDTSAGGPLLIAEDEPGLRELYDFWLGDRLELRLAADGTEAIEWFDDQVQAALLDRQLPGACGTEILQEIRAESLCPVGIISADAPSVDILSMPIDTYVRKPIDRETVTRTVDQLLAVQSFDCAVREYFALSAKLRTLRSEASGLAIASNPAYQAAEERVGALSDQAAEAMASLEDPSPALTSLLTEFTR